MEIGNFVKQSGQFLNAEDVSKNPDSVFVPTTEGEMVTNKFGNERLHVKGDFGGHPVVFDLSKTNAREIAQMHGEDTKNWIGKTIKLETYKTRTTEGKMTEAIGIKTEPINDTQTKSPSLS